MANTPKKRNEFLERLLHGEIREQVKRMVERSGKSMVDVARDAGLGRTTLYRLAGEVPCDFSMHSLIVLADSLGYDVDVRLRRRK